MKAGKNLPTKSKNDVSDLLLAPWELGNTAIQNLSSFPLHRFLRLKITILLALSAKLLVPQGEEYTRGDKN